MQPATATSRRPGLFAKPRIVMALLVVIVAIGLGLRLYGLDWDQGNLFHPDERSIYLRADCMYRTLTHDPGWLSCANYDFPLDKPGIPSLGTFLDADRSPLNPHWFPLGSVLIYILVIARAAMEPLMGNVGLGDMATVGRTLAALADTGSVLLLFALGQRLYGRSTGLLAAGLGAFTVATIQLAHFYRPEPFIILLALAGFWSMLNVVERGHWRDHLWLGIMVGLSFGFKPTSLHLLAPLAVTYGAAAWRAWDFYRLMVPAVAIVTVAAQGLAAGAVALVTFGLLEPYAFLDFAKFVSDLAWETDIARTAGQVPYTLQYVGAPKGLYELRQTAVWALGLPLGVVAWGGLLITIARSWRRAHLGDLLLLAWVIPVLLTAAAFEVKFLRYVAPVLPVMVLLGSRWLVAGHGWAAARSLSLRRLAAIGITLLVAATAFYGLAFTTIYSRPHPAVQASQWANATVPTGATILTDNHWDEGFPDLGRYRVIQLPMHEGDRPEKIQSLAERLAGADYLMVYSNRPFGSIARLPDRYPLSSRYYQLLFDGGLGYVLEQAFASYPSLLGVSFAHDPFTRAQVPRPTSLPGVDPWGITLNLGYADGNVTNYDHPLVLVFGNRERLSAGVIIEKIAPGVGLQTPKAVSPSPPPSEPLVAADPDDPIASSSGEPATPGQGDYVFVPGTTPLAAAPTEGLLLSEEAWAIQRQGGTWSDLFSEHGLVQRVPWLVWLLLVEAIALAALPLAVTVFRWLPDRGVVLARPLGLLVVAWLSWLGASAGWWDFSRSSVLAALPALALTSGFLLYRQRSSMLDQARRHWRYLVSVEALFLAAFFVFLIIRAANPDLWHPWRGGEKPMDLAYLTAVVKSTTMPPYDPWYAGGYINYYYFGQYIVATLIKVTGIVPSVAYNLAIPLLFALTVTGAFAIGHNLTEFIRRRQYPHLPVRSTLIAGIAAALLVGVLANLDGAAQLVQGAWGWANGDGFPAFDFWRSSRLMPGQWSITEFPFWSFLFADLHAHVIGIPFTLLALGLALNLALSAGEKLSWQSRLPGLGFLALALGALAAINTWDVPAYGLLALAAIAVVIVGRRRTLNLGLLVQWLAGAALLGAVAYAMFLPFHSHYDSPFSGLKPSPERTAFWSYVAVHGVMFFLVGSWLVVESYRRLGLRTGKLISSGPGAASAQAFTPAKRSLVPPQAAAVGLAITGAVLLSLAGWETVGVLLVFALLTIALAAHWLDARRKAEAPAYLFLLTVVGMALAIGIGVDVVSMTNDIDRMNTVFKFYMDAWVLLGVASGVALWHLWASGVVSWKPSAPLASRGPLLSRGWTAVLALLVLCSAVFPVLGTKARLADRFTVLPLTLDGAAYQQAAVYSDPGPSGRANAFYPLDADAKALEYMRRRIDGSPVVLEAVTDQYRWTPRVADYTGLPVVMGWEWHQTQQRHRYSLEVHRRFNDVNTMYSTGDVDRALRLLSRYQVEYIYVGAVERLYYPEAGLQKFQALLGNGLEIFYESAEVTIYRVLPEA